ncbi:DUF7683 domain-containing protein [Veronia pacifica]|uniref:DUF7683 domain-containing protein n=1 Tax=Veronia pacifica TaxID=1080227 RepID=A0A1C3EIM0_9GAMM|nr:hypothetical protein [Veronia pacifica]ODA33077.1 hypothetical protein A8L45_11580 [Veronia pacifica]
MVEAEFTVKRYLTEFSLETEELLAEYDLGSFDLSKFQVEFDEPNTENPMFDCYTIKEKNVEFLREYLTNEPKWDFINRTYFIEAHAILTSSPTPRPCCT